MRRLIFFTITLLTAIALSACSTCPVPPSASRTYSFNMTGGEAPRNR